MKKENFMIWINVIVTLVLMTSCSTEEELISITSNDHDPGISIDKSRDACDEAFDLENLVNINYGTKAYYLEPDLKRYIPIAICLCFFVFGVFLVTEYEKAKSSRVL